MSNLKALISKTSKSNVVHNSFGNSHNRRYDVNAGHNNSYGKGGFNPTYGRGGPIKICTYCGKQSHIVDTCYKKHNFPPRFKFKNPNCSPNNMFTEDLSIDKVQEGNNETAHISFTQDQCQKLLSLI